MCKISVLPLMVMMLISGILTRSVAQEKVWSSSVEPVKEMEILRKQIKRPDRGGMRERSY